MQASASGYEGVVNGALPAMTELSLLSTAYKLKAKAPRLLSGPVFSTDAASKNNISLLACMDKLHLSSNLMHVH